MAKSTSKRRTKKKSTAGVRSPAARKPSRKLVSAKAAPKLTKGAAKKPRQAAPASDPVAPRKGKWVFGFGDGKAEGRPGMRASLGAGNAPVYGATAARFLA